MTEPCKCHNNAGWLNLLLAEITAAAYEFGNDAENRIIDKHVVAALDIAFDHYSELMKVNDHLKHVYNSGG